MGARDAAAACATVSFESGPGPAHVLDDPAAAALVAFFRAKGLARLKQEDRAEEWYQDWIDHQARHHIYADMLCPERDSARGGRLDLRRLTRFLETAAYFSPAHGYSLHVSFLGLFPILMSDNHELRREALAALADGGLFAFGVSERVHGSDLFANEFTVRRDGEGRLVADGSKFYIGNANAAAMVSVLARDAGAPAGGGRRPPFVFFALRPGFPAPRKIRTIGVRTAFVGEFDVRGHVVAERDVIARGRAAWDALFHTIDLGKFLLGFGAIGICEHAFAEAVAHLRSRTLYGSPATELPHIRTTLTLAYARLLAMKAYAVRALDYLECAGPDERRYLLYNAVQKARVSTEGVTVMALLSECVGARGVESETYFESALRDAQLVPGLEGSTHINFGLTAGFVTPYFAAAAGEGPAAPRCRPAEGLRDGVENPQWFERPDRNAKSVRFGHFLAAYAPLADVANVRLFTGQAEALAAFVRASEVSPAAPPDLAQKIALGRCFAVVAFAQLAAEMCDFAELPRALVCVMFHGLVQDASSHALALSALLPVDDPRRALLAHVVRVPETSPADFEAMWRRIEDGGR